MKKIILLLLVCFVSTIWSNPPEGINISKSGNKYNINLSLPNYQFEQIEVDGKSYTYIKASDCGTTIEVGQAALPQISFNIPITGNNDLRNINFNILSTETVSISNQLYPFQEPWPRNMPLKDRPFSFDNSYYKSNGNINGPYYKISDPFIIGGVKGVTVTLYPFAYDPINKQIKIIKSADLSLELPNPIEKVNYLSDTYNNFLRSFFAYFEAGSSKLLSNYLIITAPEFEASLANFVNHKASMGFNVTLVTTATTGTTTTSIKTYIQQLFNNIGTRPEFILLVGDVDKVPAWTGTGTGSPKTDLNYVQLAGADYYADAFIGRFSITNTTQLNRLIEKSIYMENSLGALPKKNVFMSSVDNWSITEGTHNFVINNYFEPAGYTNLKLYSQTYNATTQQVLNALNNNQLFAIFSGHGSETSWADDPPVSSAQVHALTNNQMYPFVYSFACVTGAYAINECFGEAWIRAQNGGVSFYGSSVNSYWDEDDILEKRLFKAMFDENLTKVTPMFDRAKYLTVQHYGGSIGPNTMMLRYVEMYNLMGDPSIETKRVVPPDSTAPDPVTDLAVSNATSNTLKLTWTAPYDSTYGGVQSYEIRYSTQPINQGNFNQGTQVVIAQQSDTVGTPKQYTVTGLNPATTYYFAIKAYDMWNNASNISNIANGQTYIAPVISVTPSAINRTLEPGQTVVDTVYIANTTQQPSTLDYSINFENISYPAKMIGYRLIPVNNPEKIDAEKGEDNYGGGQAIEGSGGPDLFGYKWIDSNEPQGPQYEWNDIVSTGTLVTGWTPTGTFGATDEGYAGPINLGFNFKFYGQVKTQIYLSTNGFITFGTLNQNTFTNASIPSTSYPNELICPFWDDLDAKAPGTVHYKQDGNKMIIQWTNYQRYSGTASYTFQVHLYSSGKILVYYKEMTGTINSATVGVENADGTIGLQVVKDANYVVNNLALKISADPEWFVTSNTLSGQLYNGNSAAFEVTFKSEDYPAGSYSMDMVVSSNASNSPSVTVPVSLIIGTIPVELTSFTYNVNKDNVVLNWETATETNNKGFSVQRKQINTSDWNEIAFVEGKGTTAEKQNYSYNDKNLIPAQYVYRLKQVDFDGTFTYSSEIEVDLEIPTTFVLEQNFPNPFNPTTNIKFGIPSDNFVNISVYNSIGEKVADLVNGELRAGYHTVQLNANNLSSGMYYYRIKTGQFEQTKKMLLIK